MTELHWTFYDERGEWEAYSDFGVFRIAVCNDGSFTLHESDPELFCNTPTWSSLGAAKDYCDERLNELIRQENKQCL